MAVQGRMAGNKKNRGILPNVRTFSLQKNLSGISKNKDERFLKPNEALDIINMHSIKDGTWSADRIGYSHVNGTVVESGASIDGVHWFTDADQVDYLLLAANGKLKQVNTSTGIVTDADAAAGYALGSAVDFQNFNGYVYTCDGSIAKPRRWDGTTAADSGGFPISDGSNSFSKPKYVEQHQNRLAYLGFDGFPDHIAISDQDAAETFTQPASAANHSFIAEVAPGVGGILTGARSLPIPNSNEDTLVIFKSRGIYALIGASGLATDADKFKIIRINSEFGAFNNRCIVQVGQDILALNEYGIISYSSANNSGTIQPVGINVNRIRDVVDRINLTARSKCWGIHLADRREVWFGVPTGASTQVNEFIVYKYPDPGEPESLPRWTRRTGLIAGHGALLNKTFYIGTYTGFVGQMFNASTYHLTGINWKYAYPSWDLGNELQFKRILHAESVFRLRSNQIVTIKTEWRGGGNNDIYSDSYMVESAAGSAVYGSAVYGSSVYGSASELTQEFPVPGNGKRIKFTLSGTTNTSGPEFLGLSIKSEVGGISSHWN